MLVTFPVTGSMFAVYTFEGALPRINVKKASAVPKNGLVRVALL